MEVGTVSNSPVAASIDTVSAEFLWQREKARLCRDLYHGVDGMRLAGQAYVEKGDGESTLAYETRLNRPALLNSFKRTVEYMKGQVFQRNVSLGDDADERFKLFSEDVNHAGDNLTSWASKVFEYGLRDGVVFCLADYSAIQLRTSQDGATEYYDETEEVWKTKTLAEDAKKGWSPYLVEVQASDVLDIWTENRDGKEVITHFRYLERGLEPSELSEWSRQEVVRVHVWWQDKWQRYVRHGSDPNYELEAEGGNPLGYIPLSVFMPGDKRGPMSASPALIDLAELNRRHWAASCGHCELMEYVRRPVWFGKLLGRIRNADGTESDVVVGAGRMIASEDAQADLKSVGVDSGAVTASSQELETLKNEMAMYGLQLLQPKSGKQTATEVSRNANENNCTLAGWALKFQDFLENCLYDISQWWGMEEGPSVNINNVFTREAKDEYLLEMYRAGAISHETYLELLKASGSLPDDFDVEGETDKIARTTLMNGSSVGISSLSSLLNGKAQPSTSLLNPVDQMPQPKPQEPQVK